MTKMGPFFESVRVKVDVVALVRVHGLRCSKASVSYSVCCRLWKAKRAKNTLHFYMLNMLISRVNNTYFTRLIRVVYVWKISMLNTHEICVKCMWKIILNGSVPLAAEDLALTIYVSLGGCTIHILGYHHLTCLIIVFFSFLLFFV